MCFSSNGEWVSITSNNFMDGIRHIDGSGLLMDIYLYKTKSQNEWDSDSELFFPFNANVNSDKPYSTGHPFLSADGTTLFFSSNKSGGFGGYDIYMSERVDLGWKDPINLGQPLNDFTDQYSFVVNGKGDFAYYSKEQGKGSKIYSTTIPAQLQIKRKSNIVRGIVVDATTKNPLKAKIELHDLSANKLISTFTSDSTSGSYLFVLPSQSDYAVHANSAGYLFASLNFNVADETSEKIVNLELPPIAKNAEVTLKNIFFEFVYYIQ
jgi:hypothetical protein